jgi:hypothetical protein
MDKVHDLGHERLLGILSMAWCIPLLLEGTTCVHWVMATLEEARPNPVLLVCIVLCDHFPIGSNVAPGFPVHQIVYRPTTNHRPHQYHERNRQVPKMGAHIPKYLQLLVNLVGYRLVSLPRFESTLSTSEDEICISRPHNLALLRP